MAKPVWDGISNRLDPIRQVPGDTGGPGPSPALTAADDGGSWIGWTIDAAAGGIADVATLAIQHPLIALTGLASVGASLLVTRNLFVVSATAFLAIAALLGSEPVLEPGRRILFWIGCCAASAAYLTALAGEQRRALRAREALATESAKLDRLRRKYEAEVRWRLAERKPAPPGSAATGERSAPARRRGKTRKPPEAAPVTAGKPPADTPERGIRLPAWLVRGIGMDHPLRWRSRAGEP